MKLSVCQMDWQFEREFRISYNSKRHITATRVILTDGDFAGRGEAVGLYYHGETPASIREQIESLRTTIERGVDRAWLQYALPPGGARNALDTALWDLEAKKCNLSAWEVAKAEPAGPVVTDFTISLDTPEAMARAASAVHQMRRLKLKLDGTNDLERVAAVRHARPEAELLVDANQAWTAELLYKLAPIFADEFDVRIIEQPLPVGRDEGLKNFSSPIPICADESCQTRQSLPDLLGKYSHINIKLDKTGGLTEALLLADEATALGFKLMVGCMGGSSLSMAPAVVIASRCDWVDLDGPLLLAGDCEHPLAYERDLLMPPSRDLWG